MLTEDGCLSRRQALWSATASEGCGAILLSDPNSLIRYANFYVSPFVFQGSSGRGLLVLEPKRATLISDNQAAKAFGGQAYADAQEKPLFYEGRASAPHREGLLAMSALDCLLDLKPKRLGIEAATAPAGVISRLKDALPDLECVDLDPTIRRLRRAKGPDELETLKRSMRAIDAGQVAALERTRPGMTERDVYHLVQQTAWDALGGEQAIVYGDFASSSQGQTSRRGGPPTERTIAAGDLFILDFSVVVRGYRGDTANSFAVGAPPSDAQRKLYDACMEALRAGEAALKPGAAGRKIDAIVRGALAARGLGENFKSHVGHGVGLNHLEPPFIVPESTDTLEVGDVLTLEPGQYVEGTGGMRFERNYLIVPGGFEALTSHPLTLEQP